MIKFYPSLISHPEQSPVNTPTIQLEQFQTQVHTLQQQLSQRDQTILDLVRKYFSLIILLLVFLMCNYLLHLRDQFLRIYENIPAIIFKESDTRDLILSLIF